MQITLGGFTFHSDDYPGETGFTIWEQSGWTGGAGSKRQSAARDNAHGAFRVRSHRPDRMFTFAGRYHGSSLADVQHMNDALSGLEGLSLPVVVAWDETRWADVEVDRVRFDPAGYAARADYQVELWMPDPFKYGETRTTVSAGNSSTYGAIVAAHHRGNTSALPKFTVTATSNMTAGYQIKGKDRTFEVPGPLNVGQVDKVDFSKGTVRRNGVLVAGVVPRTFDVKGGESADWRLWPLSGAGSATMHLTDTYN